MNADLLFVGGKIYTADPTQPSVEAVAVAGATVIGTGRAALAMKDKRTRTVDLAGRSMTPGFYDAHQHQVTRGLALSNIDAVSNDIDTLLDRIEKRAGQEPEGTWLQGFGYDDAVLGRHPTREDLDKVTPAHPAFIVRTCNHMLVANSRALVLAGINASTPDPAGGVIDRFPDTGEPTGLLREAAMAHVRRIVPAPTLEHVKAAIVKAAQANLAAGVTSVWEAALDPQQLEAYLELEGAAALPVRVTLAQRFIGTDGSRVPLPQPFRRPMLSMAAVKLILDGAIGPRTAAVSRGYVDEPDNHGLLMYEPRDLESAIRDIETAGLQASFHAIGDRAIRAALDALEAVTPGRPDRGGPGSVRARIEHCGIATPEIQARLAAAGAAAVVQPPFLRYQGETFVRNLGEEQASLAYPIRSLLRRCRAVAGSSDAPVVPDCRPLQGMQIAMLRDTSKGRVLAPAERLTFGEALGLYTSGGAAAAREDWFKGSITAGLVADLVVLGGDPANVPTAELDSIPIEMVFLNGAQVV